MKKDKYFFHGHARLAEERQKLWSSQQEAADFFGVSRVTWGQCERGNATPSGEVLAGLAQQGADVMYVLTGERTRQSASSGYSDEIVRRAVVEAVDLLSLDDSVDATQLAKAVVKLCGKAPVAAPQAPSVRFEGSQQNFNAPTNQVFGGDLVMTQPEKPKKKSPKN